MSALETNHISPRDRGRFATAAPGASNRDREAESLMRATEHQIYEPHTSPPCRSVATWRNALQETWRRSGYLGIQTQT